MLLLCSPGCKESMQVRYYRVSGSDRTVLFLRQRAQGLWRAERGAAGPLLHAEEEAAERILPHGDLTTTG